jgi:tRNA (cmo5U34)-methyltransferase
MKKSRHNSSNLPPEDRLYATPREAITQFVFDESVASVFEDMIGRSVPGYSTLLSMFPVLSRYFIKPHTLCYDLGCSLGASTLAMQQGIEQPDVGIIAIDNSAAMVAKCQQLMQQHAADSDIRVQQADICDVEISNASMVVMNFTLQFIDESVRTELIAKICQGINKGGVFVLSEKIKHEDPAQEERMVSLHHAFKKANGYSELEISQKRSALENVLRPETTGQHLQRLKTAGFSECFVWFQSFNFVSILAIK